MKIRHSYEILAVFFMGWFIILGLIIFRTLRIQDELVRNEQHRFRSFMLIIELFQSSEDLTRMARSYVSTDNPVYEQRYYEILDIRNGKRPRPTRYPVTYWHLARAKGGTAVAPGETVALQELMRREGFIEKEFRLLREAQANSDHLVSMEQQAFAAMKGLYDDGQGNFTARRPPDRAFASGLLFSDQYFAEKARIMAPIQQCMDAIDARTRTELSDCQFNLRQHILAALVAVLVALLALTSKFIHTFRRILNPIEHLRAQVAAIAAGRYSARCDQVSANEIGELCAHFNHMAAVLEADILSRQRAEATLKQSEGQVRLLLNSTAEAIYGIDLQGDCTFANPSCLRMLGYTDPQQLLGKNMHRLIHHSYAGGKPMPVEVCRIYKAFHEGRGSHVDDEVLWKADGTSFPAEYWSYPQVTDGKVTGAVVTFIDITRRKETEEALAHSYAYWMSILEKTPFGIVIIDRQRNIRWANATACQLAGVKSLDEIQGQFCGKYLCPAQRHACPILDKKQKVDNSERILRRQDGRIIPIMKTVIETQMQGEDVLLEAFIDISARKAAEKAIEVEKQRLASILEGTNVGTWEWQVQTGATTFNERWAEMIGYTLAELAPVTIETWNQFTHPDDLKTSGDLLAKHFRKELPYYECEARMRHKDGRWVWVLDRGKVATWTPDGKPLIMSGTHQDITARKVAEERLMYLEHIFLHDIMNTAVALRGFSYLIAEGNADKQTEKTFMQSIASLSDRIIDEINAHRQIKAAEDKTLAVKKENINSLSLLSALNNTYHRADLLESRELQLDAAAQSVDFISDKTLLSRVIGNMIKNAIEASAPGEKITIGCFAREQRIHFWVHNPASIPENIRDRIFNRSFSTKGTGRGLGTYSMKFLTEEYLQGRIAFVSTEREGTTFTAEYPITPA